MKFDGGGNAVTQKLPRYGITRHSVSKAATPGSTLRGARSDNRGQRLPGGDELHRYGVDTMPGVFRRQPFPFEDMP